MMIHVGGTYLIRLGWFKGNHLQVQHISSMKHLPLASGVVIETGTRINCPVSGLEPNSDPIVDKEALIRKKAQELLKAGNRKAALKLLASLKK